MSNFNDFLGMQAAKLNMTREEYTAYYLSESKPGPKPYHRGLGDDEIKDKKEQIKKQSDMSDDNSAAYKEMPGDKEARDKGEVKTSKHVKKYHELYGDKKDESVVSEGKMPDKLTNDDDIVFLKTSENSKGAHYNLYYKGHDIDFGGVRFGTEKQLNDYAKEYILSRQWYNKLRYEDAKPLPESVVNEWGSSDQATFNKSMHKEMGSPRKMPSPFDDKLRDVAADNVDHYWDDWDEYDTDRDGLIDNAVRHYLRAFFKKDFEMMQKMFASNNITEGMSKSAIKKAIKVIDKQIDNETGGDGEALDNETLQALEQERERLQAMNESKFSPLGYAKRVISGEITLKDAMKEAGISLSNISKLIKKLDKSFDVDSAVLAESRVNEKAEGDRGPISDPKIEKALKTKSEETGVPIGIIRIVMRRGMAAWKTGHRPGATEQQWGYARVNAFLTKGKGTWGDADKDVAKEVRDEGHDGGLKEHFDQSYRTI